MHPYAIKYSTLKQPVPKEHIAHYTLNYVQNGKWFQLYNMVNSRWPYEDLLVTTEQDFVFSVFNPGSEILSS